jgi:pimeloyl-ACP methyl ester carboxylesterase
MSAIGTTDAAAPEPLYFPAGGHQLFGWLNPAAPGSAPGWGVVICSAFGYEAHCGHNSARAFAEAAAALGMPTLRFDYLGTGDSPDIDVSADQIEAWVSDIAHAVAELRRRTGVQRVCLLGFRLGALLATRAAGQCHVEALALVAPVLNGRRYLKESRALQMAAAAAAAEAAATHGAVPVSEAAPDLASGTTELSGHLLSSASVASLRQLAAPQSMPGVSTVLLIDRNDLPVGREWAQALGGAGASVEYQALPGFVEMMMTSPQFAVVPQQMLEAARRWLSALPVGAGAAGRPDDVEVRAAPAACQVMLPGADDARAAGITERPTFLTADHMLFGIVTEPGRDEVRRRAVIVPNNGAEYHVGASRMNVALARRWARRGYYVLRMNLSGLGDSRTRPGRKDNDVFPPDAVADIRAAIEFMKTRYDIRDITLAGLCSGAYHSLRAAVAGLPVQRLLLVNPQNYFWDEGMRLDELQLAEVMQNPAIYRERLFTLAAWKRLLTGRMNVLRVLRTYSAVPLLPFKSRLRNLGRMLGVPLHNDLGRELETIVARGVRVVFIFARGEPGLKLLEFEAGAVLRRLGERFRLRIVEGADHTFSRFNARKVLEEVLSEELFAAPGPVAAAAEKEAQCLQA